MVGLGRVELPTRSLGIGQFLPIPFLFSLERSALFGVVRGGSEAILQLNLQRSVFYDIGLHMKGTFSTREAAEKLGVTILTLQRHVAAKTVDAPAIVKVGGVAVRLWTNRDIEKARKVLLGTKPGRKKKKA
jgi:hypothetical protein